MCLGLFYHPVNLALGKSGGRLNLDALLFSGSHILCRNMDNTVSIDIKSNLDLWNSPWCRWNAYQVKVAQCLVVCSHLSLALENMDGNCGLAVCCGGEDLALPCRNSSVPLDQLGEYTAQGLDTK